jgi:predicted MPP superfamily phosphohydrolase
MSSFALPVFALSVVGWITAVGFARSERNRFFATFLAVVLALQGLLATGLAPLVPAGFRAPFLALHAAVYVHFLLLARPRMRPLAHRLLVSGPASFFAAGTFLALPWAVVAAFGGRPPGLAVPYALAALGVIQSIRARETETDLVIGSASSGGPGVEGEIVAESPRARPRPTDPRPIRVVQISDPHLGPFMSVERLRRICARAVARRPDLIVLTGDYLTMESQSDRRHLTEALAPLSEMRGRVYACLGNHDHEALEIVTSALESNGITLLVDEATVVETDAGPVQILGLDFHFRDRAGRIAAACARNPRVEGATRLVLLHDPSAFRHVPPGDADLVLSGHTHGGQVGLLSLGRAWTFLRLFGNAIPDHGVWARGRDRLYVHRGTGHYGFPIRLGVPSEEGLLRIHRAGVA